MHGTTHPDPPTDATGATAPSRWRLRTGAPEVVVERDGGYLWRFAATGSGRITAVLEGPRSRGTRVEARPGAFLRAHPDLARVPGLAEALARAVAAAALEAAA
jgi:hypothetical protein